jgi:L-lysine 6-transaminase
MVSNVRGRGLLCAFDLRTGTERNDLRGKAFQRGLVILGCGDKSLRFRPPLTITPHEVDEGVEMLRQSLKEMKG